MLCCIASCTCWLQKISHIYDRESLIVFEWDSATQSEFFGGRTTFFFSATTMLLVRDFVQFMTHFHKGPFLVFTPMQPIQLKSKSVFNTVIKTVDAKFTRILNFVLFCVVTAFQAVAVYNLWKFTGNLGVNCCRSALF